MRRQRRDRRRPRAPVASFWAGLFLLLLAMVLLRPPEETPPPAPTPHPRAAALLSALPGDLEPSRRALVETACTLVGRVDYFWGGKSTVLGWDSRWGTPARVTAPGCGHLMYGQITQIDYGSTEFASHAATRVPKFSLNQEADIRKLRLGARPLAAPHNYCPYIYAAGVVS